MFKKIIFKLLPFLDSKRSFKQFIRFCIVGAICAVLNFSIYYSLTEWLGVWYVMSGAVAFIITAIINFIANKFWTFQNNKRGKEILNQVGKFAIVMISGVIINSSILYFITEFFGIDYRLSWVVATGIVTFWNYVLNRFWTFRTG
jgi:dolichol-phosphate mannosyltransferase